MLFLANEFLKDVASIDETTSFLFVLNTKYLVAFFDFFDFYTNCYV